MLRAKNATQQPLDEHGAALAGSPVYVDKSELIV